MVKSMVNAVKVNEQSRMVLPSRVREAFGIKKGGQITIRMDGSKVILKPINTDVKKKVQEWVNLSRNLKAEILTEDPSESWKWMSREYARRKLGLSIGRY
jgi:AbrB family looped-hinge helix DNA binding protein